MEQTKLLELTAFSKQNPMGYDDKPDFTHDLWPFLNKHASSITNTYVLETSGLLGKGTAEVMRLVDRRIESHIADFGSLDTIDEKLTQQIRLLSFYGGHLSVWYRTKELNVAIEFCRLWNQVGEIMDLKDLPLDSKDIETLTRGLISTLGTDILLSFGHDGDPAYLLGNSSILQEITRA